MTSLGSLHLMTLIHRWTVFSSTTKVCNHPTIHALVHFWQRTTEKLLQNLFTEMLQVSIKLVTPKLW